MGESQSVAQYETLVSVIVEPLFLLDAEARVRSLNPAAERCYRWTQAELAGRSFFEVMPQMYRKVAQARLEALQRGAELAPIDGRHLRKDGSTFVARVTLIPHRVGGRLEAIWVHSRPLDSLEDHTPVHERVVRQLSQTMTPMGSFESVLDGDSATLHWSPELYAITGIAPGTPVTNKTYDTLVHPEDLAVAIAARNKGIAETNSFDHQFRIVRPDGQVRWLHAVAKVTRSEGGKPVAVSGVMRDVTDLHHALNELKRVQDQLHGAQKMEAIGSLAGGIAHDFNNILTVILSNTMMAAESVPKDSEAREDLDDVKKAAERATQLVRQLLAFGRRQVLRSRPLDLEQLLEQLAPMLHRLLGEQIELLVACDSGLPDVIADPAQMEQVVLNLCVNARDAMPNGGTLTLELSAVDLDDTFVASHPGSSRGRFVRLKVTDDGTGMPPEVQARIFEPFFTTKGERGTGLGLSTVFGIVKQSGGSIYVQSDTGRGTTFDLYLPCTAHGAAVAQHSEAPEASGGEETVLLVEDDPQVRALVRSVLRGAGYQVLEAASPGDALLLAEQHARPIDLLLTDVVMPRMNGRELSERIKARSPATEVLFMSGYTDDAIVHHGVLEGGVDFIEKPLTPGTLLRRVRAALDRAAAGR